MAGFSAAAIYSYTATPSARDYHTISDDMRKQMGVTPPFIERRGNYTRVAIKGLYGISCELRQRNIGASTDTL